MRNDAGTGADATTPFVPDPCKSSLAAGGDAIVTVGEGQTFFRFVDDLTVLGWEKGPQGGHHVWIALRMRGLRMQGTIITIDMEDVKDPAKPILVNHSRLIYDFDRDEGGFCTRAGLRMQLDNAGGVTLAELQGHPIKVTVTLFDPDGARATDTLTIVVNGSLD